MNRWPLVVVLLALFFHCRIDGNKQPSRPNILLILADDMGYGDVSAAGNPYLRTPHLDALAQSGVRFSNFYVSPVCAPTRASLLTGRYHQRTGVQSVTNGYEMMDPQENTLAEYLQGAGYRTALFGKWHLGEHYPSLPNAQGFDEFLGFRTGHTEDYYDPVLEYNGAQVQKQGYITDVLTDEAARYMLADSEKPFFCYLAYNAPHTPLHIDSSGWGPFVQQGLDERTARVYAMIENLDENVGRLLRQLQEKELREETIVIFLSDNGPISGWRLPQEKMRYNASLRDQKFSVYEGGIRTQAYWSWPGHWPEGREVNTNAAHIDLLPSLLDILALDLPATNKPADGLSLQDLLINGEDPATEDRIFFQQYDIGHLEQPAPFPGGIARWGKWKMVNDTALYDLAADPGERNNLADRSPEVMAKLKTAYTDWWEDISTNSRLQPAPIPVGYPEADTVFLPPHYGRVQGSLVFLGRRGLVGENTGRHPSGVDGDWLGHWEQVGDGISWNIEVVTPGRYEIGVQVRNSEAAKAVEWELWVGEEQLQASLPPDRRYGEWTYVSLGAVVLEVGEYPVRLVLVGEPAVGLEVKGGYLVRI